MKPASINQDLNHHLTIPEEDVEESGKKPVPNKNAPRYKSQQRNSISGEMNSSNLRGGRSKTLANLSTISNDNPLRNSVQMRREDHPDLIDAYSS